MNSEIKPVSRKTGKLIAKNIVILTVLIAVCALSIWAWFTRNTRATADGINVIAKAEGVEVSWDGVDYYYDLTAIEEKDYKAHITGYAKNLYDEDGNPAQLKLVTGNGIDFFEPYVNRRTGTVLFDGDVDTANWQGVDIVDGENSQGKYIDLDLYFRGSNASNIYLAKDSSVTPKDGSTNGEHKSAYGSFSKDNIAAASRLAFLDVNKTVDEDGNESESIGDCNFIWAPNANQILDGNSSGYDRFTTLTTEKGGMNAAKIPDGMLHEPIYNDDGSIKSYYIWLPDYYPSDAETQISSISCYEMKFVVVDETTRKGLYVFDNWTYDSDGNVIKKPEISIPNRGSGSMDIPYMVSDNASTYSTEWDFTDTIIQNSLNTKDSSDSSTPNVKLEQQRFTLADSNQTQLPKITFNSYGNDELHLVIGYNPYSTDSVGSDNKDYANALIVLAYESTDNEKLYDRAGYFDSNKEDSYYYELPNETTNVALVNPKSAVAVSSVQYNKKIVTFSDSPTNNNVTSLSVTLNEQFTATKTGEGIDAKYTFKSKQSGNFIKIKDDGTFDWSTTGSSFSLYYDEDFSGPLLKSGEYFLAVVNNEVVAVHEDNMEADQAITVYIGTEYTFGTGNEEEYKYYDNTEKKLVTLYANNPYVEPKLFTTNAGEESELEFGTCIAELTEENDYTAHIVVRIWVEGTDREAQTPLAEGIFDISLHFTTKYTNTQ